MSKRMTKEQKDAINHYSRTLYGQDNYLNSVFVSEAQSAYWTKCVDEAAEKCAALGVPVRQEVVNA